MKVCVSSSISNFKEKVNKSFKLKDWRCNKRDIYKPTLFFGMYHIGDYWKFIWQRKYRNVIWCGDDIRYTCNYEKWFPLYAIFPWWIIFRIFKANHYCENYKEKETLLSRGIKAMIRPTFVNDVSDFPVCFKPSATPHIYLAMNKDREEEYGLSEVKLIAKELKDFTFHIYGVSGKSEKNIVYHGRVPEKQFHNEIRNYQCGLRLNSFDGFSEITAKSVLMGQYSITRLKYPYIWQAKTTQSVITLLKKVQTMNKPNLRASEFWRKNINNYPFLCNHI